MLQDDGGLEVNDGNDGNADDDEDDEDDEETTTQSFVYLDGSGQYRYIMQVNRSATIKPLLRNFSVKFVSTNSGKLRQRTTWVWLQNFFFGDKFSKRQFLPPF